MGHERSSIPKKKLNFVNVNQQEILHIINIKINGNSRHSVGATNLKMSSISYSKYYQTFV